MRFFIRLIVLILVMALTRAATFGITTWYYRIPVLKDATTQLYGSIGAAVLALLVGLILVPSKKKKKQPAKVEEKPKQEEKKIETAKVITEPMGITVDEIPQQPDLQEMPQYDEPDIDMFHTSMALPVISEEEEEAEALKAKAEEKIDLPEIEDISEEIEEEKPFVDDTTRVISTASIKEYLDHVEKGEKVTETSVSQASAPKFQTVVSPFGPRTAKENAEAVGEPEQIVEELIQEEPTVEEVVYETPVKEEPVQQEPQQENIIENTQDAIDWSAGDDVIKEEIPEYQPQPQPIKEDMLDNTLTRTREQFITSSTMSYIDETGKPQFHVTEEIKKVEISDEELGIGKDFEGFDVKAERAERVNHILNTIIAILAIRLAMIVIYYFYTRFFG